MDGQGDRQPKKQCSGVGRRERYPTITKKKTKRLSAKKNQNQKAKNKDNPSNPYHNKNHEITSIYILPQSHPTFAFTTNKCRRNDAQKNTSTVEHGGK
jgi:hypothetical protein